MVEQLDVDIEKNANRFRSIPMHKTQVQAEQKPQHISSYTEPERKESLKHIGTRGQYNT